MEKRTHGLCESVNRKTDNISKRLEIDLKTKSFNEKERVSIMRLPPDFYVGCDTNGIQEAEYM